MSDNTNTQPSANDKPVFTVEHGDFAVEIFLKRQPSGFKHHAYTAPVKVRIGKTGKKIITKTYSSQDEAEHIESISLASRKCRELDAVLFGLTEGRFKGAAE